MSYINTEHLAKSLEVLNKSYELIKQCNKDSVEYEIYRNSIIKGFEMTLEQSGKLLRKKLEPFFASKKAVDTLNFKDLFRYANKHSLLDSNSVERWLEYRDNRNNTAHDYGEHFADETLKLIEEFIKDAKRLEEIIKND
ncbi:nucleotidyltransferase substrate binding protein [Campylobacter sp. RM16192]|uniref:nucleotidyltransferase substrate binding protein n=1 Tax=Campylobacter sp. RM16192 TaxID=1660080 RepID=UPI001451098F|nr:nucleotidyltransferase substrate binding protein [Campylobacter sp. RM16192]QCD52673.1 nucleotidyltransferase, substrate-binding protein [Campylobacter sp. RM16192]